MAQGAYIEAKLIESKAYLSLTGMASKVLLLFMLKRQFEKVTVGKPGKREKRTCVNLESLTLTYVEVQKKYGITQPRFTRSIDELLEKGFITKVNQGGGYQKDKAVYALSNKYLFWKPGDVFEKRKKDPVQRGFRKPRRNPKAENQKTGGSHAAG